MNILNYYKLPKNILSINSMHIISKYKMYINHGLSHNMIIVLLV